MNVELDPGSVRSGTVIPTHPRRIRILHSVGHLSRGGIENWLFQLIKRLDPERFEHHVMVWTREQEAFTAEFLAAGVRVHALPGHINPVRFAKQFRKLVKADGPFEILHTHGTQFHGFVMLLASTASIRVRIAHSHTDIQPVLHHARLIYRAYAKIGHLAIRLLSTGGLAVSELAAVSMFGKDWRTDPRWRVLYCGVDLRSFSIAPDPSLRNELKIPARCRVIGHVGRFEIQKNHEFLIEVIAAACRLEPDIHFLLIGNGTLRDNCVERVRERGLDSHVTFITDCRTVPQYMVSAMDGFVLPSLYEGLGLVAVEAQAAGLACLLSDRVPSEASVVRGRATHLPLEVGAERWARALLSLPPRIDSRHPGVAAEIAAHGFEIVDAVASIDQYYREAVQRSVVQKTRLGQPAKALERPVVFIAHPSDLLTDHLPNGDGLVAYGFIRELLRRDYRLHIATRGTALQAPLPANAVMHPIPRRFRSELLDRLHYMLAIRRLLRRLRRDEQIDLVHQMNPVFAGLSLGLAGCGLPIVLGTYVARWPRGESYEYGHAALRTRVTSIGRWLINLMHQSTASALLITTPAATNRIPLPGMSRRKSHVVRHGIDTTLFHPGTGTGVSAGDRPPTILFYSHLDQRKGVFILVDAFCLLVREMPEARLLMVGRGDHLEELRAHVERSGCVDRIEIRKPIKRHEAPALLRECSVYCLPSFGEPYATTVLEAMACGRPVVVTRAGGLPHMVCEEGSICVPPGDARALAEALLTVLRSDERQARMGAENRKYVESNFTWARVGDDLEAVYRQVAGLRR
ncbi:glycosyltransferase [Lichenicoccus roseus]|uniref:Glycosyltransferase n=1 Tax=Lichenicoccus roseus TaxID=2683649 RepID=A0A5R9J4I9_9PROT|nr:glycosyltransferase [Lichenicoccus roseus]TLU72540.1 glycosyltransferase [Lichenicoccus roseus]